MPRLRRIDRLAYPDKKSAGPVWVCKDGGSLGTVNPSSASGGGLTIIGLILLQRSRALMWVPRLAALCKLFLAHRRWQCTTSATGWLSAMFFVTSFGLAMIADQRFSGSDDLGFEIFLESVAPAVLDGDIPVLEEESGSDLPADLPLTKAMTVFAEVVELVDTLS